jgi:hypothetical protein
VKKPILWVLLASVFNIAPQAIAEVSTRVCLADGNTPLELADPCIPFVYRDIMVGTKLKIIVSSNVNEYWGDGFGNDGGSLAIEEAYWDYGVLSARGPKVGEDWSGSHLPAAGNEALVWHWGETGIDGFDLYTGSTGIQAGDWFIIDYNAINIGTCDVGFYDHRISWDNPVYYLKFSHVRTRDFNKDTKVDLSDFVVFASHWQETSCNDPNWCQGTDLDTDGNVEIDDLMLFADYWLERTE